MPLRVSLVPPDFERSTHHERLRQRRLELIHDPIDAIRIGIVQIVHLDRIIFLPQRIGDKLGPQRRTANAPRSTRA